MGGEPSRWLAAMSTRCADAANGVQRIKDLLLLGITSVVLNIHDEPTCAVPSAAALPVRLTHVMGMKAAFWQAELGDVDRYDYVWLLDADVAPYAPPLTLALLERWFERTHAGVLQPSVVAATRAARTSDHRNLRARAFQANCAAACARVEQMTPIFSAKLWSAFHREILRAVPADLAATTVWGLNQAWTGFAHARNLTAVIVLDAFIVHDDTRTYDGLLNLTTPPRVLQRASRRHKGAKMYAYLHEHVPRIMAAATCDGRRKCYPRVTMPMAPTRVKL